MAANLPSKLRKLNKWLTEPAQRKTLESYVAEFTDAHAAGRNTVKRTAVKEMKHNWEKQKKGVFPPSLKQALEKVSLRTYTVGDIADPRSRKSLSGFITTGRRTAQRFMSSMPESTLASPFSPPRRKSQSSRGSPVSSRRPRLRASGSSTTWDTTRRR